MPTAPAPAPSISPALSIERATFCGGWRRRPASGVCGEALVAQPRPQRHVLRVSELRRGELGSSQIGRRRDVGADDEERTAGGADTIRIASPSDWA